MNRDLREIRAVMPGRLEMRTTGEQYQEGSRGCLLDHQVQPFQGRWVRPVQVFQDKEYRLALSVFQEDGDKGFEGFCRCRCGETGSAG